MSTIFTWGINTLDRELANGCVSTVHYTVNATDGTYASSAYGSIGLEAPDPEDMIPYASLTEAQCVHWLQEWPGGERNVAETRAALDAELTEKRTPTTGKGVPWQ